MGLDVAGREQWLQPAAAAGWQHMRADAESRGVMLLLVSAFRSFEQQRQILERKLAAGQALEHILAVNAPPGYSQHHSGNAVDLATPGYALLSEDFERTDAFVWLQLHSAFYGFSLTFLSLTIHDGGRVWKGLDWNLMDLLHEKGWIVDPQSKAKSVVLTRRRTLGERVSAASFWVPRHVVSISGILAVQVFSSSDTKYGRRRGPILTGS